MMGKFLYGLFLLQLYAVLSNYLLNNISFLAPVYLILISIGITVFIAFLLYVLSPGRLFMFLLILFTNFLMIRFNTLYNIIVFVALYLYILDLLKERALFNTRRAFALAPIMLLGVIPIRWKGLFEAGIGKKIHTLLYSTGGNSLLPNNGNEININVSMSPSISVALESGKETFKTMPSFQSFIILSVLLIVLTIFALFLIKFYKTEKKSTFYKSLLISITVAIATITSVSFLFLDVFIRSYKDVLSSLIAESRAKGIPPEVFYKNNIKTITHKVVASDKFISSMRSFFSYSGIALGLISIVLGIFIAYATYKLLFNENVPASILNKDMLNKYKKRIREKGISMSLIEITDPEDFVKFLYFSVLYLFSKKNFAIKKFETPDEFYKRVLTYIQAPLPYFKELTSLFDVVKYSKQKVLESDVKALRMHYDELLESIKRVTFKEISSNIDNSDKESI